MVLAGCLDIDSSRKAARLLGFVMHLKSILTLVDVQDFTRYVTGIWRRYQAWCEIAFAYGGNSSKVTVITRKATGEHMTLCHRSI